MKILLVVGSLNQGGAEFQLLSLARLFQSKGLQVEVIALTDYNYFLPYIHEHNLAYSCVSNEGSNFQRTIRAIKLINSRRPDLVISYIKKVSQVAIFAKLFSGFKFKLIIAERTSLIIPWHDLFYFNLALLANIITVNAVSKYNYIKRRFPYLKSRVVFVPNIIDINKYHSNTRKEYNTGCVRLGCVGRISPEKNLLNLVKAVLQLLDKGCFLQLTFTGQTNHAAHLEELQTLISNSAHAGSFHIEGPSDNMVRSYAEMDLLCHVSLYEGFSNVVAEAMCAGLPVIGSNIEEISFFIKDGENGFLVNPFSAEEIANGIEKFVVLSAEKKTALSENSKKKAAELFDNDSVFDAYSGMFSRLGLK